MHMAVKDFEQIFTTELLERIHVLCYLLLYLDWSHLRMSKDVQSPIIMVLKSFIIVMPITSAL